MLDDADIHPPDESAATPSLLDWLSAQWSQPVVQRVFRFGLAALAAVWGLYLWLGASNGVGFFLIALAIGLALWGLAVRGANTFTLNPSGLPEVNLTWSAAPAAAPVVEPSAAPGVRATGSVMALLGPLRLPAVFVFPLLGQLLFLGPLENRPWGLAFYGLGLALFGLVVWRERLLFAPAAVAVAEPRPLILRRTLLLTTLAAGVIAFATAGANRFTPVNVSAWLVAVAAWLGATLSFAGWREWAERALAAVRAGLFTLRVTWIGVALIGVLAVGAYFRLADVDVLPPEMTSDHVEKLLDVADLVLGGQTKIFFERNTGREPFQFYWTALIGQLLDTGVSHLSLKIGTGLLGLFMLPYVFLLGRELEDDSLGLLACALAAISFWATAISRVGLRFPLYPLFAAPVLYYLFRGLRRGQRNDFLFAGLFLGVGLYGYSPIRVVPLAVLVIVGIYCLRPSARGRRVEVLTNTVLLFVTMLVVFLPLMRYATQHPEAFWERSLTRLTENEQAYPGSPLVIFLQNVWNGLLMFNWQGDSVWANTIVGRPILDVISGALLVLGVGYMLARLILRRDWVAGTLLALIFVLMLPSTLSLAFPNENPSVARTGGAIPVVFMIAAYPLWLLLKRVRAASLGSTGTGVAALTLVVLLGAATTQNNDMYFREYRQQYLLSAQNASEIGQVIHDFARSFGSYDTAWVRPFPYWVDTRAVGMYAGEVYHDYAIQLADLAATVAEPGAKLFILHPLDVQETRPDGEPPTLPELRRLYPEGRLSVYHSARLDRDFLVFFVPAQPGTGEGQAAAP